MGDAADILTTEADCILKPIALIFRISFEIIVIKFGTEVLKYLPTLAQLIGVELTLGDWLVVFDKILFSWKLFE